MTTLPFGIRVGLFGSKAAKGDGRPHQADDSAAEAGLVEAAKTDRGAFGQLFEAYYERILTYAYRCTLNLAVAEEVTSNTFFNALRALPKYRRGAGFSAWVYRIATNEIRMHWRFERRRRTSASASSCLEQLQSTYFDSSALESDEERREKMLAYARLHEVLAQLPERYRSVIILRFFEDLQYEAIAHVLGKRMGTVKSLLHRALARLRLLLDKDATFFPPRHSER